MREKFPYGYDVNAYIDKAFEQMKADFPWATREMIADNTNLGIEKMDGEYQYVSYHSQYDGTRKAYKEDLDCEEFLRRLACLLSVGYFSPGTLANVATDINDKNLISHVNLAQMHIIKHFLRARLPHLFIAGMPEQANTDDNAAFEC